MSDLKMDLRFTDTKEAIQKLGNALRESPLTDNAIAALIVEMGKGITKTQVKLVLERARNLESRYIKKEKLK